jgi:glutamyl-tRNA synthetase
MILGQDGAKLSKRHGAVSVLQYREEGFLPEALLNYLVRLGWSHGDQEIFSIQEMTQLFDINDVNKSASAFNADKLLWINQQHIMRATPQRLAMYLKPQLAALGISTEDEPKLMAVACAQQERAKTLKEMAQNSAFFFREIDSYDPKAAQKNLTADATPVLQSVSAKLEILGSWDKQALHTALQDYSAESGLALGKIAQPLRVAVSGGSVSPPIDVTLEVLGRSDTLARISRAVQWIAARP